MCTCEKTAEQLKELFKDGPVHYAVIYRFMHHTSDVGDVYKYIILNYRDKPLFVCERGRESDYFQDTTEEEQQLYYIKNKIKELSKDEE